MSKVVIIGGGAAGMMAAISAAGNGDNVTLLEKNEKLGKKVYITGKGRCNITNACETSELFNSIFSNKKFMYSAIYSYDNNAVIDFFNENGCPVKIERGNRVFPVSDKSSDVIKALNQKMKGLKVDIRLNCEVKDIVKENNEFIVKYIDERNLNKNIQCDKVIVATGGKSYASTGSTGDGYVFAKKFGHTIKELTPALVPFELKGDDYKQMQGLALKNINFVVKDSCSNTTIYKEFGEMLFTHFGISGPVILSSGNAVSTFIQKAKKKNKDYNILISIDLKPALDIETLDARLLRDFKENLNKQLKNSLDALLPKSIIPVVIKKSEIDEEKMVNSITKQERLALVNTIKNLEFEFNRFRDFNEAIITKGGIDVKEINPSTMESKLVPGLYFAGEILDVDAATGGYNLQIAWSSGYMAGQNYE